MTTPDAHPSVVGRMPNPSHVEADNGHSAYRRAWLHLGVPNGKWPVIVGATIGLGFLALNFATYLLG